MARKAIRRKAKAVAKPKAKTIRAVKKARAGKAAKIKPPQAQVKADIKAAHGELPQWTKAEIEEAFRRFQAAMPEPKGELQHINPFTLLVAVVLSAQATDAGVNKATPALFKLADTPEKMAALGEERVRELIKTIGLYRNKAKNVIALSEKLVTEHGSQVPSTREALQALPGVGRKTANVVLNMAFGQPTMAVDTHVFRIGNRAGLAPGKDPLAVELKLLDVIPEQYMMHAHHWLILHGRYTCLARRPLCEKCVIADLCKWPGKTVLTVQHPAPPNLDGMEGRMVSKLDIAGNHIKAAIQMIAIGANPYSTHVIVMACEEMVRSISEAQKKKLAGGFDDAIKPDRLKEWRQYLRSAYNFFKHADRDPDQHYQGPDADKLNTLNEIMTMLNCASYMELSGTAPDEMKLFMNLIAFRHHANVFDDKFFEKFPEAEATAKKLANENPDSWRFGIRYMLHAQGLLPDSPT